jgi:hypothetical protein
MKITGATASHGGVFTVRVKSCNRQIGTDFLPYQFNFLPRAASQDNLPGHAGITENHGDPGISQIE